MPPITPAPDRSWRKWLSVAALALLVSYMVGHVASTGVLFLTDEATHIPVMPVILGAQGVALVAGAVWLARMPYLWRRVQRGLTLAGILAIAALVLLVIVVGGQMVRDSSMDQGGATAGFFALLLFGVPFLLQAALFLFGGAMAGRRAKSAGV